MLLAVALAGAASAAQPRVVATSPRTGDTEVSPALDALSVTFDQDMGAGFSWVGGGPEYPGRKDRTPSWKDQRTCVLPVKLAPGSEYHLGLNGPSHQQFRSAAGVPLDPVVYGFKTKGGR